VAQLNVQSQERPSELPGFALYPSGKIDRLRYSKKNFNITLENFNLRMPIGRMLNKKISYDEALAGVSLEAAFLYTWCIPHLDVKGRIYADPNILKGTVVPYVKKLTIKRISECCQELHNCGLVVLYGESPKYMEFCGFSKNQKINEDREADSNIPGPDELMINSGVTQTQVKVSKDKLSEGKVRENPYQAFEDLVFKEWNEFCLKYPALSRITEVSESRRQKLKARFTKESFRDFDKVLQAITEQPFLINGNPNSKDHKDWKVNFDWLIANDTNYIKVLERKYKNDNGSDTSIRRFIKQS
jgi:hypothetical protein